MNSTALKFALGLICACVAGAPRQASAYTPVATLPMGPGAINIYIPPNNYPCTLKLDVQVAADGSAAVVGALFSAPGSVVCPWGSGNNFPWPLSAAVIQSPGVYSYTINAVDFTIQPPNVWGIRCAGTLTVKMDQNYAPHRVSLSGALHSVAPFAGMQCIISQISGYWLPTYVRAP